MRKITIELYANSDLRLSERLKEIEWAITRSVWPHCPFTKKVRKLKDSGFIEEEKEYLLVDYEYDKEDPTWSSCNPMVTTGRWKMEVVSDQDYVNFQKSEEL